MAGAGRQRADRRGRQRPCAGGRFRLMETSPTNWAGNHVIAGERLHRPRSLTEMREIVAGERHLRVLGTGHTFNDLPDSRGDLVSLARMPTRFEIAAEGRLTIDAGIRYADL